MIKSSSGNVNGKSAIPGIADFGQPLAAATESCSAWLQNSGMVQSEVIRFMGERFRSNADLVKEFVACKTPVDAVQLQMQFASKMASDYMEESQRLLSIFSQAAADIGSGTARPD